MIAYVLPTRDRAKELAVSLDLLGALPAHDGEVIVVDNASRTPLKVPTALKNGMPVALVKRGTNEGAAGRNAGVRASEPVCEWVVMLDDDSAPVNADVLRVLKEQPRDVMAVQAEIVLENWDDPLSTTGGGREAGGLPEVFIGCGVAVRREVFLELGGYDAAFHYYAEEYDLAAKMLLAGGRVAMDRRFRVCHRKVRAGRNMNRILRRLVRNNTWVMQRYAPEACRRQEVARTIKRYGAISLRERAEIGYAMGILDLSLTMGSAQPRREMNQELWDRFTGKAACRASLQAAWEHKRFTSATLIERGKNEHVVREVLREMGVRVVDADQDAEAVVIATMSPGPMLDAWELLGGREHEWLVSPWMELTGRPGGGEGVRAAA